MNQLINVQSRNDLPKFFKEMGYKVGAEIGVYNGRFTKDFCKVGLKMFAIDPWMIYDNWKNHSRELECETLFENTKKLLAPYDCTIIRKTSMEALKDIPDESLDFVYIDGNHSLPYITQDIYEWNKKIRNGGTMSGHDYFIDKHGPYWIRVCHVKYAVDSCIKIFKVKNLYILNKDRHPSWMWIKNE